MPLRDTVSIVLTQAYTDTNIPVTVGETIMISASGTLQYEPAASCKTTCTTTPAGDPPADCNNSSFTAPGLNCWSLIGKIGVNGTPFQVGDSLTFTATTSGTLYLGVNDDYYSDNTGSWTAIVTN